MNPDEALLWAGKTGVKYTPDPAILYGEPGKTSSLKKFLIDQHRNDNELTMNDFHRLKKEVESIRDGEYRQKYNSEVAVYGVKIVGTFEEWRVQEEIKDAAAAVRKLAEKAASVGGDLRNGMVQAIDPNGNVVIGIDPAHAGMGEALRTAQNELKHTQILMDELSVERDVLLRQRDEAWDGLLLRSDLEERIAGWLESQSPDFANAAEAVRNAALQRKEEAE